MITQSWRSWGWRLCSAWLAIGGALACLGGGALAQITSDPTLGSENSTVTSTGSVDQINGGATRGANLFHSFQEFNVNEGRAAVFTNPAGIENIVSRVTGANPSYILGTLGVSGGNANLFLINPNGIIFGPNARLDVGGSFVGTTANAIGLANGDIFSANSAEPLPSQLLNVNPNAFFFNQIAAQPVINRSTAGSAGLEVPQGRSLLLVGGDVRLEGGRLQAPGGRVELGGLASPGSIGLSVNGSDLLLSVPVELPRADVLLNNGADVNVRAGGGGSITINAQNLNISGVSTLQAGIDSELGSVGSQAGDIEINATGAIALTEQSSIVNSVQSEAIGKGGDIEIITGSLSVTKGSELFASTNGQGDAGSVNIEARDTVKFVGESPDFNSSIASSQVERRGVGQAGSVNIKTRSLSLTKGAFVSASSYGQGNAGNVTIEARDTVEFAGLGADRFPSGAYSLVRNPAKGNAGSITIKAGTLSVTDGAVLATSTFGQGNAGNVLIDARDRVEFKGGDEIGLRDFPYGGAYSRVQVGAKGNAGTISITTGALSVTDGALLTTSAFGQGNAGNVTIEARDTVEFAGLGPDSFSSGAYSLVRNRSEGNGGSISIKARSLSVTNGAVLATSTFGQGNAGNVTIDARDRVEFKSGDEIGRDFPYSGAYSRVEAGAEAQKGGDINIKTGSLSVNNGAELSTSTDGIGNAGNVTIEARDTVAFKGLSFGGIPSGAYSQVLTGARGQGGNVTIKARSLSVTDGAVLATSTFGQGNAGNVTIDARDRVEFKGGDEIGSVFPYGGAYSQVESSGVGKGGDLNITTGQLIVQDGAQVAVSSEGTGNAGNLEVTSRNLQLKNRGTLRATTASGEGGNITLREQNLILMRGNSEISTEARGTGNGGNIEIINADFIVAVPSEDSDIVADAFGGNGGNINITAQGIFGLQFREQRLPESSDITASSRFGVDGVVEINTPDVDPNRGLVNLPAQPIATEVVQACQPGGSQANSEFVVTGRGGLPPTPSEALSSDAIQVDWVSLNPGVENRFSPAQTTNPPAPAPFVEAQGWVIGANGDVILTASAPTVTPHSLWRTPATCHK